jgi:hypothetical protein
MKHMRVGDEVEQHSPVNADVVGETQAGVRRASHEKSVAVEHEALRLEISSQGSGDDPG